MDVGVAYLRGVAEFWPHLCLAILNLCLKIQILVKCPHLLRVAQALA